MSVYIQEVLGLLKRNKKKKKLDKMRDHFEFGKLYQNSSLNTGAVYNPKMEPFVVKWGDLVCEATENLTRTKPGEGKLGFVPVYTTPEGSCAWDTLMDSIITQNAIGDTINIAGDLYVEGTITTPTLTEDRIVIVGPGGVLEDDANFTMDGITFTALVNVQHGSSTLAPVPPTTTTFNSNIVLSGPVIDSQGNLGQLSQVLVGLADGRVIWSDDDVVEALTYGSLWQGNVNNLKQELPIGTADQILISDGVTFSWEDNPAAIVGEQCEIYRIPLWTPNSNTLGCSLLIQDGDSTTPASRVINDGELQQTKSIFLDDVNQDDTLTQVLVRDPAQQNVVRWRDALSIVPELGWDLIDPSLGITNWDVDKYNGYMEVTNPTAFRAIRPNNLLNADEGYFVFVADSPNIPLDYLLFTGVNGGTTQTVRTTWSGDAASGFPYVPTNQSGGFWLQGVAVKFHYILRIDAAGNQIIWWDACCEIQPLNQCPIVQNTSISLVEDTTLTGQTLTASDPDGDPLTWSIVTAPPASHGTVNLNSATGVYDFVPAVNFCGTGTFTWKVTDGSCEKEATTTYNISCVCDVPKFAVYQGANQPCGAASTAPLYTGASGGAYQWVGDYCDPDNAYTDVTLTTEYSLDGGTTWIAGLPAGATIQKDVPAPWKFTFDQPSVPAGNQQFRFTLQDVDVTCKSEYIFNVTAALDILNRFEFQVSNEAGTATAAAALFPFRANTNLPVFGATGGTWNPSALPNSQNWMGNYVNQGRRLTQFTSQPNGLAGSGLSNNDEALNITPSGGTYPGVANSTFQLVYVTAGYQTNSTLIETRTPNIWVNPMSYPANDNISVGDTIIFDAATINNAFNLSGGNAVTGSLTYVIQNEDVGYAPLATSAITLAANANSGHACNDGAFKIYAAITNASGATEVYYLLRTSTSNGSPQNPFTNNPNPIRRYSLDSVSPSIGYLTGPGGRTWSRSYSSGTQAGVGNAGAPAIMSSSNIDYTFRGSAMSKSNTMYNYDGGYVIPQNNQDTDYSSTGAQRLQADVIQQIAANSIDGNIVFYIAGDTWAKTSATTLATGIISSVDANGGVTGITLQSGGVGYNQGLFTSTASGTTRAEYFLSGGDNQCSAFVTMSGTTVNESIQSVISISRPGSGYVVGQPFAFDPDLTWVAHSHGDAATLRIFKEDPNNTLDQIEVFNGPPFNNTGTATGTAFKAGDGTSVQVNIFTGVVTIL